jgi:hypothetical protein
MYAKSKGVVGALVPMSQSGKFWKACFVNLPIILQGDNFFCKDKELATVRRPHSAMACLRRLCCLRLVVVHRDAVVNACHPAHLTLPQMFHTLVESMSCQFRTLKSRANPEEYSALARLRRDCVSTVTLMATLYQRLGRPVQKAKMADNLHWPMDVTFFGNDVDSLSTSASVLVFLCALSSPAMCR